MYRPSNLITIDIKHSSTIIQSHYYAAKFVLLTSYTITSHTILTPCPSIPPTNGPRQSPAQSTRPCVRARWATTRAHRPVAPTSSGPTSRRPWRADHGNPRWKGVDGEGENGEPLTVHAG